jgi:hypothetical protein
MNARSHVIYSQMGPSVNRALLLVLVGFIPPPNIFPTWPGCESFLEDSHRQLQGQFSTFCAPLHRYPSFLRNNMKHSIHNACC